MLLKYLVEGRDPPSYMIYGIMTADNLNMHAESHWPGLRLNIKTIFPSMGIPILKIRRSQDRLISNMGIPVLVSRHLYIETPPGSSISTPDWLTLFFRDYFTEDGRPSNGEYVNLITYIKTKQNDKHVRDLWTQPICDTSSQLTSTCNSAAERISTSLHVVVLSYWFAVYRSFVTKP